MQYRASFRTLANNYDGDFFAKIANGLKDHKGSTINSPHLLILNHHLIKENNLMGLAKLNSAKHYLQFIEPV